MQNQTKAISLQQAPTASPRTQNNTNCMKLEALICSLKRSLL
jgi:hypothetical protein